MSPSKSSPAPDGVPCGQAGRLTLRRFRPEDAGDVAALHTLPEVRAHLSDDHPLQELAVAQLMVQRLLDFYPRQPGLGIWHASDAAGFVGWFSLMPLAERAGAIDLGSRLHPRAWGSGIALDGGECLLAHAFHTLGAAQVWGACAPANRGARLCLHALGFSAEGIHTYDRHPALHHRLSAAHWQHWSRTPRRERLRHAVACTRDAHACH
ncbi:acetyltransferase, ribosomal protein N-acetylase [Burkholderiales bacterium JOSHI_001]|nr:acetyltransferase, ribosomal protein N-acetylase [Burkholderiales bacterium JOSHI_001]